MQIHKSDTDKQKSLDMNISIDFIGHSATLTNRAKDPLISAEVQQRLAN